MLIYLSIQLFMYICIYLLIRHSTASLLASFYSSVIRRTKRATGLRPPPHFRPLPIRTSQVRTISSPLLKSSYGSCESLLSSKLARPIAQPRTPEPSWRHIPVADDPAVTWLRPRPIIFVFSLSFLRPSPARQHKIAIHQGLKEIF